MHRRLLIADAFVLVAGTGVVSAQPNHVIGMASVSTTVANPGINLKIAYDSISAVEKVHASVRRAVEHPSIRKHIEETGSLVVGDTSEPCRGQIVAEYDIEKKVVTMQKLRPD